MAKLSENSYTTDGVYNLSILGPGEGTFVVSARGTFGGGTLTFGVIGDDSNPGGPGVFIPFTDPVPLTADGQVQFTVGPLVQTAMQLTGSTGADIKVGWSQGF